jgi:hypothetical protein
MQNRRFSLDSAASRSRNFKVVVAFDDTATSSPALKTCEYVISQLGDDIQVRRKIVDFNATTPQRRAAAARDAAKADMVIVSTREDEELPASMQEWIDEWSTNRATDEGALVAILNRSTSGAAPRVRARLANVARQAHMDFFSSEVSPV